MNDKAFAIVEHVIGSTDGNVWGSNPYKQSSDIRTAAVHAGLVKDGERKYIAVTTCPRKLSCKGSLANGVASKDDPQEALCLHLAPAQNLINSERRTRSNQLHKFFPTFLPPPPPRSAPLLSPLPPLLLSPPPTPSSVTEACHSDEDGVHPVVALGAKASGSSNSSSHRSSSNSTKLLAKVPAHGTKGDKVKDVAKVVDKEEAQEKKVRSRLKKHRQQALPPAVNAVPVVGPAAIDAFGGPARVSLREQWSWFCTSSHKEEVGHVFATCWDDCFIRVQKTRL